MESLLKSKIKIVDWGLIPYQEAFERQKQLVDEILAGRESEQIVFCSHPPVVTLGRGTVDGDVFGWAGETVSVNRGGRATYHGPSQVVMYPLLYVGKSDDRFLPKTLPANDLHAYMRALELSVLDVLKMFGVMGEAHPLQTQIGDDEAKEATGVWIGYQKIAAIGIAVKAWVTSHGVALNVWHDPQAFIGINPCGFRKDQVVSLEDLIDKKIERALIIESWSRAICERLLENSK